MPYSQTSILSRFYFFIPYKQHWACHCIWLQYLMTILLQKHLLLHTGSRGNSSDAGKPQIQRLDPLFGLTRSEVFAPQLGGKEGWWGGGWTKEHLLLLTIITSGQNHTHTCAHISAWKTSGCQEAWRMHCQAKKHSVWEAFTVTAPSRYYWANHLACPLPSSPLCCSSHLHFFFLLSLSFFAFLSFSAWR